MSNIRVDLEATVINGQDLIFKSPADCSQITGLIVYYPEGDTTTSKTFQFVDAHGNNVGSVSLFAEDVLVKVILDTELSRAYVQNADTNAYIEDTFLKKSGGTMASALAMGGNQITGLGTPTATGDALPKGYTVPVSEGGTGATTAENARTNLGITPANIGAAAASHGNHVPTTETADNARFLRNDNTWQAVTPANIGARANTWTPTATDVGALPAIQDTTYTSCYYRMNGSDKEWINPPLVNGVEYLTVERWFGSLVYCKSFEVTMSDGGTITIDNAVRIIRTEGFVQSRGTLPIMYADLSNAYAAWLRAESYKITMCCGSSVASKTAWITAYYIKG